MKLISRKEAKEQGLTHYFTGKECKRGHVSKRYVSTRKCFQCCPIVDNEYIKNNNKKFRKLYREYNKKFKEKHDGNLYYFTGEPCIRGHVSKRLVSNRSCIECSKESHLENRDERLKVMKKRYHENKDYYSMYSKKWYLENRESVLDRVNKYRIENKEYLKEYYKNYYYENKNKYVAFSAKRKSQKINSTPNWLNKEQENQLKYIYRLREILSNDYITYHVDHIIPLQNDKVCGLHVPWNLQILTAQDNLSKSNKIIKDYI